MFYTLRKKLAVIRQDQVFRAITATRPLSLVDAPFTIVSMVGSADLYAYLVALKSVYSRLGRGRVVALLDGPRSDLFMQTLKTHVPGIEIVWMADMDMRGFQRGGCWERLVYCLGLARERYVIQLDADVLAYGPLDAVEAAIADNAPFAVSGGRTAGVIPAAEMSHLARDWSNAYVGVEFEQQLENLPEAASQYYMRASAGFCSYARGGFSLEQLKVFYDQMQALMPTRWHEWGTEQSASNFAIANSPKAFVLPWPDYSNYGLDNPSFGARPGSASGCLLHFIGSHRYKEGTYLALGRSEIARLPPL